MEDASSNQPAPKLLDIRQIMSILPHRYPLLLIDRVVEISQRKRIVAIKNVTINEQFFQGHFPDYAIMPGVLVVEAIAQAGGVLLLPEIPEHETKLMVFSGIDHARFRRPVVPGDQLRIEVDVLQWKPRAARLEGKVYVDKKLVCEAQIMCQVVPRPGKIVNVSEGGIAAPAPDSAAPPDSESVNPE
jgi:3-hydroxyacyl-[acyl-carrier-protein] dehydratase